MAEMTSEEWRAFLTEPARTAKLATVRADGRPHVAPIWFVLDGDTVVFTTGATTVKGRSILADPRVALCVDDDRPPFSFVLIEGRAEVVVDDPDALLLWATRLGARYMGADQAEAYGRRNAVPGELLVRVSPTRVVAHKNIAD
ncbi:MAG TPA: PPOX class F420-dependent oxidoreductase [Acidimicrobiales bacterium]|nr:PPOX class F420-dependent oxidoreductase [Acidimicrobiales bacterium]